jgi:hypothetical protein
MIRFVPRGIETRSVSEEMIYVPCLRFALTIERVVLARAKYNFLATAVLFRCGGGGDEWH